MCKNNFLSKKILKNIFSKKNLPGAIVSSLCRTMTLPTSTFLSSSWQSPSCSMPPRSERRDSLSMFESENDLQTYSLFFEDKAKRNFLRFLVIRMKVLQFKFENTSRNILVMFQMFYL